MLEVQDIHTYYGNIHALKGVSLTVNEGEIVGIKACELDTIKLRITNSIRSLCDPIPFFEFFSVNMSNDPELAILVCQVDELKRKPCLVHSRAYVRSGPSAQRADSAEIRKMVLE